MGQKQKPAEQDISGGPPAFFLGFDLDVDRAAKIKQNEEKLKQIGVNQAVTDFKQAAKRDSEAVRANNTSTQAAKKAPRTERSRAPSRRSARLAGQAAPEAVELDDNDMPVRGAAGEEGDAAAGPALIDLLEGLPFGERVGRKNDRKGYKNPLAITCHFCRQKLPCSEPECPRCVEKSPTAACIGKTRCNGCKGHGRSILCRTCLMCRYGEKMEEVRANPAWLCPHCRQEASGGWQQHGWFCNSSFCMRDKGLAPTGVAVTTATALGYTSVAHLLQAKWLERRQRLTAQAPGNA